MRRRCVLFGPANAGKSSLHARLTGSHTDIGPYPYTTKLPVPGMLTFEDVHFQLVANKSDLAPDPGEVAALEELVGVRFPAVAVSAETGQGLEKIGALLFRGLEIVRVYTKAPGRPVDEDRPFAVRRSGTVADVARLVHKDIARSLRFARVWGQGTFDGQQVGPDHPVNDGDVLELYTR